MKISFGPDYSGDSKPVFPKINPIQLFQLLRFDAPFFLLLVSNIITIVFAVIQHWSLGTLMFIYWAQSVIIGIFNFVRILRLKQFSTENFYINHRPTLPTPRTKYFTAFFFLVHYGIFHFGYLAFILGGSDLAVSGVFLVLISSIIFFINHWFSYKTYREKDDAKKPNIGRIMFFPYARIVPMHLTIVLGGMFIQSTGTLIFFLGLKTLADLIMHQIEHFD